MYLRRLSFLLVLFILSISLSTAFAEKGSERDVLSKVIVSVEAGPKENLFVRGSFNNWMLDLKMLYVGNNTWMRELNLAPGEYGYEFYSKQSYRAKNDPVNKLTMFIDGRRYSRLVVEDSRKPILKLVKAPKSGDYDSLSFSVEYIPGTDGAGPDLNSSVVTLNGEPVNVRFDEKTSTFNVYKGGLAEGKYTYLFKIKDQDGFKAKYLYVPTWIEKKDFKWNDAFLYQVMTDRFVNGDQSNDDPVIGIPYASNWQGGDFRGLIEKLHEGYFSDMGVNAIWISSPVTNTRRAGLGVSDPHMFSAYHSYWPIAIGWTDDNQLEGIDSPIDPHFGTEEELHELVQLAHQQGIRIVVDFVANHIHEDSPLSDAPGWYNSLYVCGWDRPISCWFTDYLPDFNYKNTGVMNTVIDHAVWLIQEFDIDGYRLDAVKHMDIDFTHTMRYMVQQEVVTTGIPFYMVGETFTGDSEFGTIGWYLGEDKLDGQFDFPLFYHISRAFLLESESFEDLHAFILENDTRYQDHYFSGSIMGNFFGNHDIARAISVANYDFWPDLDPQGGGTARYLNWHNPPPAPTAEEPYKKLRMAQTFLMTSPGVPLIYQGDEFGMPGAHDPDNRRMMVFDDELNNHQTATLEHLKKLGKFRLEHPAVRYGKRKERWLNEKIMIFSSEFENDLVVVAFNKYPHSFTPEVDITKTGMVAGTLVDAITGDEFEVVEGKFELPMEERTSRLLAPKNPCPMGKINFEYDPQNDSRIPSWVTVEKVQIVGSFNNWKRGATVMKFQNGKYVANVELARGLHHYKFLVNDSMWLSDLNANAIYNQEDGHGGVNSGVFAGVTCQ